MNKSISRARLVRSMLASMLLVSLLLLVSGCLLFNIAPTAAFTISAPTGQAPFTVNFSAVLSTDEDGDITKYEWDFGDGTSGSGMNVSRTYTTAGTFIVVLMVTDNRGDSDSTQKTIHVTPAEPPGPIASFTASPTSGTAPLTVRVDASASSYAAGVIAEYHWDWGDGSVGFGRTASRTYFSARTYTVTLTVTATDGKTDTATRSITVSAPGGGGTPGAGAPSARFAISFPNANKTVAPLEVSFDPGASKAVDGRTIASYTWTFGDGHSTHTINSDAVTHVYRTDKTSEIFSVTLVVIDDIGSVGSITKTVRAYNYQPKAGFEIWDKLGPNTIDNEANVVEQADFGAVPTGTWILDNVTFNSVQTGSTTVWIQSEKPAAWVGNPADPTTVTPQGTATAKPANFNSAAAVNANLCFDPEGQGWGDAPPYLKTERPTGWTNAGWGIERIEINWGDGTTRSYDYYLRVMNGTGGRFMHTYLFTGTTATYTITITAHDFLGAQASFSRTVTLRAGT